MFGIKRLINRIDYWSYSKYRIPFVPKFFIQRALYGISDIDVANLDSYLDWVMIRGFKKLNENTVGYPMMLVDENDNTIYQFNWEDYEVSPEERERNENEKDRLYHALISKIIEGLEEFSDVDDVGYEEARKKQIKAFKLMANNWRRFWI